MSVTEKVLLAALRPEAEAYVRTIHFEARAAGEESAKQRGVIERRKAALDARLEVQRIQPEAYLKAMHALDDEERDLRHSESVARTLRIDKVPSWDDMAAMNKHLQRLWTKVQMDPEMEPTASWRDPRWRYDPEQQLAEEAEMRDPEASGLVLLPSAPRRVS